MCWINKILLTVAMLVGLMVLAPIVQAETITYKVEYSEASEYKDLSLKEATLVLQLYAGGVPHGFTKRVTNEAQEFTVDDVYGELLTVEVTAIEGQPDNIACNGVGAHEQTNIEITCQTR